MLLSPTLEIIIFVIVFAWLGAVTIFGARFLRSFQKLTKGVSERDIKSLLTEILKNVELAQRQEEEIIEKIKKMEGQGSFHFQKIGLVRYNPFSDTGGDQSFVLALLDGNDNGFVLTSLHGRDQTRIFTKPVEKGKESGYEFSKEEVAAIIRAKKGKSA